MNTFMSSFKAPILPFNGTPFPLHLPLPLYNAAVDEATTAIMTSRSMISLIALTTAAVSVQALTDVRKPNGQITPASLLAIAIAGSGDRKTTGEDSFVWTLRDFQRLQQAAYLDKKEKYQHDTVKWNNEKTRLQKSFTKLKRKGQDTSTVEAMLGEHESNKPVKPRRVKILYENSTEEAYCYGLHKHFPSAGFISSEGSGVLNGRALSKLSIPNSLYSGTPVSIDRKTTDSYELANVRLTYSILLQPSALEKYMETNGDESRGSGIWARFLVCAPQSLQGTRFITATTQSWEHRRRYAERLQELLEQNLVCLGDDNYTREIIELSPEASEQWVVIFNAIEGEIRPGGRYERASDHASKLAENILRTAAVFHYFEGFEGDISIDTLNAALRVCMAWSDDFIRIFAKPPQVQLDAMDTNEWLNNRFRKCNVRYVKKNTVRQYCPSPLRKNNRVSDALLHLHDSGNLRLFDWNGTQCLDLFPNFPDDAVTANWQLKAQTL